MRLQSIRWSLAVGFMLLVSAYASASCSKPFNMALENWPPYVYTDANGKSAGLDVELAQAIFREADCQLVIESEIPRKRRLKMFQDGTLAMLLAASETPERLKTGWFTLPYRREVTGLAALNALANGYSSIHSFADLRSRKVLLLSPNSGWYGQDYADNFDALKATSALEFYEDYQQGLRMLNAGHGTLIMGDVVALLWEAHRQKIDLQILPYVPASDEVHLMLSRMSATEADIKTLDAAITRLEKSGKLAQIRARYGLNY
ncbi:transporter substrate-binding domain-containing protein [Silvimonas sp.]|uniref:substrate-binding periplasmic protein n=1 Tax=Silvimonas sp. TaxID=2650811 RepID=UPI002851A9B0|nr:transporter substrate-binding domain-containing protein [Silvimonas sp.]MDR3429351.1 transporter substrate-binding domain-containing protein [Silvimonas sp.]